jgi:hypothetical protein
MTPRHTAILIALISLSSCGQRATLPSNETVEQAVTGANILRAKALAAGDFNLTVSNGGSMMWNGQSIDEPTLEAYTGDVARLPRPPRLVVQFQPGTPEARRRSILRQMSESELCQQKHCAEAAWGVPRPPVVY